MICYTDVDNQNSLLFKWSEKFKSKRMACLWSLPNTCVRQNKAPTKDAHVLTPRNCTCYVTHHRGIKITDRMKNVNQLTLKWKEYSRPSERASVISRALKV